MIRASLAVAVVGAALVAPPSEAKQVTPPPSPPASDRLSPPAPGVRLEYVRPPVIIPAPPKPRPEDFVSVVWSVRPVIEYPEHALQRGIAYGQVVVECRVGAEGAPEGCALLMENPVGVGFGAAVLTALRSARVSPDIPGGAAFRVPIHFRLPEPEPLAPPEPAPGPAPR